MSSQLILSIKEAMVRFKDKPIFEDLNFNLHQKSRIALVGKNGSGKTTLMKMIAGEIELEEGERWLENKIEIGYLKQEFINLSNKNILQELVSTINDDEEKKFKIDIITEALNINLKSKLIDLSGGQLRKVGLAKALINEPDILLLDEPTNHLDLEVIEWLENYLNKYNGTIICVSHDRAFLSNVTDKVFWIDRGNLKISPKGFKFFDEWSQSLLEQEEKELRNRKQSLSVDIEWASRGVKARVKRNVRRLEQIKLMQKKLEEDESSYRRAISKIKVNSNIKFKDHAKSISEFFNVSKSFNTNSEEIKILENFNVKINKGDRIGILGGNGSGKTTFLKLLLKEETPDKGTIKNFKNQEFSYFDQKRSDLFLKETIKKNMCPSGGDYINVMGKDRHVYGYLKEFQFDPKILNDYVSTLSGGQKNRLMLAKILANPKSCLILDEPTNDLDMDTLDLLEEILINYKGTLIIVSHDRDFLDQTVTRILAFQGDGQVIDCIGGYSDYLKLKKNSFKNKNFIKHNLNKFKKDNQSKISNNNKLTYKLEHELSIIPSEIQKLETIISQMNNILSDADLYTKNIDKFLESSKTLEMSKKKLDELETRWLELDLQKNKL
ncbi:ABC-F family ATP-binding cassette domain-containing protein [Alphaproteobacteria bacterium]|nr:ABC-F family ATP-binding cassette domain-containing protein [Alphaproteobacteria bacterium]